MEFKVGDKFMCINDKLTYFTKGKVYEVKEIGKPGDFHIALEDDMDSVSWGSLESLSEHFKRIDEPQVDQNEPQQADTDILDAWLNHTAYSVVNGFDEQYAQGVKKRHFVNTRHIRHQSKRH